MFRENQTKPHPLLDEQTNNKLQGVVSFISQFPIYIADDVKVCFLNSTSTLLNNDCLQTMLYKPNVFFSCRKEKLQKSSKLDNLKIKQNIIGTMALQNKLNDFSKKI